MRAETYEKVKALSDWEDNRINFKLSGEKPPEGFPTTLQEYADKVGVSVRTVYDWRASDEYKQLRAASAANLGNSMELRQMALNAIIDTLSPGTPARERLAAAKLVIELTAARNAQAEKEAAIPDTIEELEAELARISQSDKAQSANGQFERS